MNRLAGALLTLGLLAPVLCVACAGTLPEDVLWVNALGAGLLAAARPMVLLVSIWGLWAIRAGMRRGGALAVLAGLLAAGVPPLPTDGPGALLVSANVQAYGDHPEVLEAALADLDADVLLTIEHRARRVPGMERVAMAPLDKIPKTSHGLALFCKEGRLCPAQVTEEVGAPNCGMPIGILRFEASFCVVGVHAPPPVPECAEGTAPYYAEIARHLDEGRIASEWGPCQAGDPVALMGDLNAVPGSRHWWSLIHSGLEDTGALAGVWGNSWPAGGGWPWAPFFPLDRLLVGPGLEVDHLRWFATPGSDHRALRARVRAD